MANLSISATSIRRGLGKIERATQRAQVTAFNRTATAVQRQPRVRSVKKLPSRSARS